jgi:drug/metabolite transporter (DMT)-like permease
MPRRPALSPLALLIWLLNVAVDTSGHVALKYAAAAEGQNEWQRWKVMLRGAPLWIGIVCFCLEFVLWLALLSVVPLSTGVLVGSINMVSIMLAGRLLFNERLEWMRLLGMACIILGVVLVGGSR